MISTHLADGRFIAIGEKIPGVQKKPEKTTQHAEVQTPWVMMWSYSDITEELVELHSLLEPATDIQHSAIGSSEEAGSTSPVHTSSEEEQQLVDQIAEAQQEELMEYDSVSSGSLTDTPTVEEMTVLDSWELGLTPSPEFPQLIPPFGSDDDILTLTVPDDDLLHEL